MVLNLLSSIHGHPAAAGGGSAQFDGPVNDALIGLWDFEKGATNKDTGLGDGKAQNGTFEGNAFASGGQLVTDGSHDFFDVDGDDAPFQIDQGTIAVSFRQDVHVGSSPDTIVNRGEFADRATEGWFGISVTKGGAVTVQHFAGGKVLELSTASGFFKPGDTVEVVYSWDAATGGSFGVSNVTKGTEHVESFDTKGLTFAIGDDDDENFTFGARESDDGSYDRFFDGKINYVALYNSATPLPPPATPDGIVDGTPGNDLIDIAYTGDPEGDRIDADDAILPGQAPDDDIVLAGAGNDTVFAGEGDDRVFGGTGDDKIYGEAGNDMLFGGGPDTLADLGPNLIQNGSFEDTTGLNAAGFGFQGTGGVPGWTTDAGTVVDIHSDGRGGVNPTDGNNWLDLEASPGNFRIGQDVQGIADGQTYVLTFDAGDAMNTDNTFSVIWNGEVLELGGAQVFNPVNGDTQTFAFTVTGGSGDGSNRLEFEGFGTEDNIGVSIDNVQLRLLDGDMAGSGNDMIFGGTGDDLIFGGDGNDTLVGGEGSDKIYGGDGNDVIFGDGGDNDKSPGVTLTFLGEEAAFKNVVGIYEIDPATGEISNVRVAFENASEPGSGGNLAPGSSQTFQVAPGAQLGVFIVANGATLNNLGALGEGSYSFVDAQGNPATLASDNPQLVFTATDGTQTVISGNTFHSAGFGANSGLNPDDRVHTDVLSSDAQMVSFGFEDLLKPASDDDFNDSVLKLEINDVDASFSLADWKTGAVTTVSDTAITGGDAAADMLFGGAGNDVIFGGAGNDTIDGGEGNDRLFGEDGDDTIFGGSGNDQIDGGDGDDRLFGGDGNDVIRGGAGNDFIHVGGGNNVAFGGDDRDTFTGFDNTANNVVFGGDGGDDYDTLDLTGSAGDGTLKVIIEGPDSDGNGFDGKVEYFDADGMKTGQIVFKNIEKIIPCFTPGTRIATPAGEKPVEDLRPGDKVITRDHGVQTLRWVGARRLSRTELALAPDLRAVRIRAGALGHGLPERDMLVSPNHRMLVMSERTRLFFDEAEVLVAAKHLADGDGIAQVETEGVTYIHVMFDHHEVILADGAWSESFQPGDWSLRGLDREQRAELLELFPELGATAGREGYRAARRSLKKHEARLLMGG